MMGRAWIVPLLASFVVGTGSAARATDVALGVYVDGRKVDAHSKSGLLHRGVAYVNAVRAVRAFGGLLTFDPAGRTVVTIGGRTVAFTLGRASALLDGTRIAIPGPPFRLNGDIYVPLATMATLGGATYSVDRRKGRVALALGAGPGFPPAASGSAASDEDVAPSPTQALGFTTTATIDASGLHARAVITNKTSVPYTLAFPSAKQVAFVVTVDGSEAWNSSASVPAGGPSKLVIDALGTKIVTADWPGYAAGPPGRYSLRVRLMTLIPLDVAPISLDAPATAPAH